MPLLLFHLGIPGFGVSGPCAQFNAFLSRRLSTMDDDFVKKVQTTNEAKKWTGVIPGEAPNPERKLNRYGNILPYDNTRVKLLKLVKGTVKTSDC